MINHRINLAIFGQVKLIGGADDTAFEFTFPNINAKQLNEAWTSGFFDPRDARYFTPQGQDIYAVWSNREGNYYAIIFSANDGRNGRLMLALNVKSLMAQDGSVVINALQSLKNYYNNNKGQMSNNIIESYLLSFDRSLIRDNTFIDTNNAIHKGYRVFATEGDIAKMFTYIHQSDYRNLRCVYFVPNDLTMPDANFKKISTPLSVMYQIGDIPNDVTVEPSRNAVYEGSKIKITYHKDGCEDCPIEVSITGPGQKHLAIDYNGNTININDAKTARVMFMRKVYIDFVEEGTKNRVNSVIIRTPEGKQEKANSIRFLETKQSISFTAVANGYHEKNVNLHQTDLTSSRITIELKPKSTEQSIDIVFPDFTKSTIKARVKQSDPLYQYLERTGWQIRVSHQDFQKPPYYGSGEGREEAKHSIWQKIPNWLKILVPILLITLLLLFGLKKCAVWPFSEESKEDTNTDKTEQVDDNQHETEQVNTADIIADLDYLKQNDRWNKQEIKTDEFKPLIDFVKNGQVDQAFTHRYNNEGNINGYWKNCLDIYRRHANDTEFIVKAGDAMSHSFDNDVLDLQKLNSAFDILSKQNDDHAMRDVTRSSTTPLMSPAKNPKKADSKPADKPKADSKPADKPKADSKPADKPKADSKPADKPKADSKPADKPQKDKKPKDD